MKISARKITILLSALSPFAMPAIAAAHEAYVLPKDYFWNGLKQPFELRALDALRNPDNIRITFFIVLGVVSLLAANFFIRRSSFGSKLHAFIEKYSFLGPIFVRAAIAASFFLSAYTWSFLGPELELQNMPYPAAMRFCLFAASFMIAAGLFTEVAAMLSLVIFTAGFFVFGSYLFTYLNYLGEIIVLFLFGMRTFSFDAALFGKKILFADWEQYATTVVRVAYGAGLIYAGITVKFLHPDLTVKVVNDWHLTQFHWLFPSDPLLVTLGAGIAEVIIGLFIIAGFEMRLTVFISLIYVTMSLLYFRELVWPHLMLYGVSLNLMVEPETFTLDNILFKEKRRGLWHLPFLPHRR